jgi:hypothetical protein
MKTTLIRQLIILIVLLGFLAIVAGNAAAAEGNETQHVNAKTVVSPYWQSDSGSYTFIAVSHTSLSGMASQIGVTMTALPSNSRDIIGSRDGVAPGEARWGFGTALTFTVQSGTTQRVFIVRSAHPTINASSIPDAKFISGTSNYAHGSVVVTGVNIFPNIHTTATYDLASEVGGLTRSGEGYRDHTMLSYWGSVVVEKNTTGFAMEFLGDMNDSQGGYVLNGTPISGVSAP